jgi:polyisoprenoid-binding protein YceI
MIGQAIPRVSFPPTHGGGRIAAGLLAAALAGASPAAEFALDPDHTSVHFAVGHNELSYVRGRFARIGGTVQFDPSAGTGAMTIGVPANTVDTGNSALDNVLRSDQFLDADRYPEVYFASERFVFDGDRLTAIEGKLTLHGVERPLRLTPRRFACREVPFGIVRRHVCGGEFHALFSRSDFGMTRFLPAVADEVELTVDGEAARK